MVSKKYSPKIIEGESDTLDLSICLLGTRGDINLGSIARLAKNFQVSSLYLVAPEAPRNGEEYEFACKGEDLLRQAKIFDKLSDVVALDFDWVIGTTGKTGKERRVDTLREIASEPRLTKLGNRILLVFGRESRGMYQDELVHCDRLLSVPIAGDYPVMNLSHAVAVVLYEFRSCEQKTLRHPREEFVPAKSRDIMSFLNRLENFLNSFGYYEKKERHNHPATLEKILRRLKPTDDELRFLMGVFRAHQQFMDGYTSVSPPAPNDSIIEDESSE